MPRFRLLFSFILLILATKLGSAAGRPNFLFIASDDQAPHAIATLSDSAVHTPNLDRLVHSGTDAHHADTGRERSADQRRLHHEKGNGLVNATS